MRRYLSIAVAMTAALAVSACGGDANGSSDADGPITVAFPVPLTSGNKAAADLMVNTAKLAVKKINADGGAGGRQLELKVYDDKLTADESAKIAQRAITVDDAEVILGGYTSIEGLAIREVTERRKVLYLATSTVSPQLTESAKYTFRQAHDQGDYPTQMADLYAGLGFKNPVVIHDDGPTGATLYEPIIEALKAKGLTPGEPVEFQLNATDMSTAVSAVKKQNPDSIVHIGSAGADAGLMVKTLAEQGISVPVLGFGSLVSSEALNIGGPAYQKTDVYILQNKAPDKPQYQELVEAYADEYGGDPAELANTLVEQVGQTWDGFEVLRQALEATGGDTSGDKLAEAIHGLDPFEGAAGKAGAMISFDGTQDAYAESMVPFKLEGNKVVAVS